MNDREFRNRLNQDLPDAPEIFHRAMTDTLKTIVREEGKRRASSARKLRRTLLIAALITPRPPAKGLPGNPICLRGRSTAWRLPSTRPSTTAAPST